MAQAGRRKTPAKAKIELSCAAKTSATRGFNWRIWLGLTLSAAWLALGAAGKYARRRRQATGLNAIVQFAHGPLRAYDPLPVVLAHRTVTAAHRTGRCRR